ncbi:MAG: M15 family metallopeptidase [bacterium]|nr:M15 family metallopeptidase [bacterium]
MTMVRIIKRISPAVLLLALTVGCAASTPRVYDHLGEMPGWVDSVTIDGERYAVPEQWRGLRIGLPDEEEPFDLVNVPELLCAPGRHPRMRLEAFLAFRAMADMAAADSIHLRINSAYRSVETQRQLFVTRFAKGREFEEISWGVAPPGYSEHMLGTTIDLALGGNYEGNPLYQWLLDNAEMFGFYETYPPDPSNIFPWEPWHWRYYTPDERRLKELQDAHKAERAQTIPDRD